MTTFARLASLPLCLALLVALAAPAYPVGPAPFTTTHLISGANPPLVNGTNLLSAVAGAGPNTLIKLEPGFYDLGGQQINLPDFVDIEGSGRDITTILSDLSSASPPAAIVVAPDIDGEVRELTVRVGSAPTSAAAFLIESDEFLLTEVNVEIDAPGQAIGALIQGASPRLNEVFIRAWATSDATGIAIEDSSAVITDSLVFLASLGNTTIGVDILNADAVLDSVVVFSLLATQNTGLRVSGSGFTPTLRNTRVTAQGSGSAIGVEVWNNGDIEIHESTFRVDGNTNAIGLSLLDATANVAESTFAADGTAPNVFAARLSGGSNLDANRSNYESPPSGFAVRAFSPSQAQFGASQLIGNATGTLTCVFSYDGSFVPRPGTC